MHQVSNVIIITYKEEAGKKPTEQVEQHERRASTSHSSNEAESLSERQQICKTSVSVLFKEKFIKNLSNTTESLVSTADDNYCLNNKPTFLSFLYSQFHLFYFTIASKLQTVTFEETNKYYQVKMMQLVSWTV